jgi:hypothetical protein
LIVYQDQIVFSVLAIASWNLVRHHVLIRRVPMEHEGECLGLKKIQNNCQEAVSLLLGVFENQGALCSAVSKDPDSQPIKANMT